MKKNKNEDYSPLEEMIISQTFDVETMQRYSEAARQYLIAYSGTDAGEKVLVRGLKHNAESHINPDYWKSNLKQQAGYSAEDLYTADKNAEAVINGDPTRYTRTDDIGRVNDPLFDHVKLDEHGQVILGSGEQMKFIGKNGEDWFNKMMSNKDFQKYFDHDAKLSCPSDYYDGILNAADKRIEKLNFQVDRLEADGKFDIAATKQMEIDKAIQLKDNLIDSGISSHESVLARAFPKVSTAIDVGQIGHQAAMEQLKKGNWAIISGSVSVCKNVIAYFEDKKSFKEAVISVGKDVGSSGVATYGIAWGSASLGAFLKNSSSEGLRNFGSSSYGPALLAVTAYETGKSLKRLIDGEITPKECIKEIEDKSVAIVGAHFGSLAGQALIPIPVIGTMIGSVVGSVISTFVYKNCINAYKDITTINQQVEDAHAHRLMVEAQCAEAIMGIRKYRMQMQMLAAQYMSGYMQTFNQAFDLMKHSILADNIDEFIAANNLIIEKCGNEAQFHNMKEFDDFMLSDKSFKL